MRVWWTLGFLVAVACGGDGEALGSGTGGAGSGSGSGSGSDGGGGAGASSGGGGVGGGGGVEAGPVAVQVLDRSLVCKLVSNTGLGDPTANATHTRFNLMGTDLGVPVVTGADLHLFFGDSVGYQVIWPFGEDPDAVARVPAASAASDAAVLCDQLDFYVTPDVPSVANGVDPSIERDFASAWMTPPPGEPIETYIAQPPPGFPAIPGTFEVPSGGVSLGGSAFLFYAGAVELSPRPRATLSYLAKWAAPGSPPGYQILFPVDRLAAGPLGGHFIQVAPVVHEDDVVMFGTGNYRFSGIYLARKPAAGIESAGGVQLFDPTTRAWVSAEALGQRQREAIVPLLENDGVGELSAQWIEAAGLWLLVYQRELHDPGGNIVDNRIVLRAARFPEGPWSDAATVIDMADPAFLASHCCGADCQGEQILHCDKAGLYGAYALPFVGVTRDGDASELSIHFVASTWDPYNVVLFSTNVRVEPAP